MAISTVFPRLSRLLSAYGELTAIVLQSQDGTLRVYGVSPWRSFSFSAEVESLPDFGFICTPAALIPAFNLLNAEIALTNDELEFRGRVNADDNAVVLTVRVPRVAAILETQVKGLLSSVKAAVEKADESNKLCAVSSVITPWQALAKIGPRLFLTTDLTYAGNPGAAAFYGNEATYTNLLEGEPQQVDTRFVGELHALGGASLDLHFANGLFIAVGEGGAFAVSEPAKTQRNTYSRFKQRYDALLEFPRVTLKYSVARDVFVSVLDGIQAEITARDGGVEIQNGVNCLAYTDTSEFSCMCEITQAHASAALQALGTVTDIEMGYGSSGANELLLFAGGGVDIVIPADSIIGSED
jgi:hypothetical protein